MFRNRLDALRIDLIVRERTMETSLPLFCEEEEPPCRPVTHDVNNSLPPVAERGMKHEGMSHESRRERGKGGRRIRGDLFFCSGAELEGRVGEGS